MRMSKKNGLVQVGQEFPTSKGHLRVVCCHVNEAILEKWEYGRHVGYVVAGGIYIAGDKLCWLNGTHRECVAEFSNATPFEAFRKSWDFLTRDKPLYVLLANLCTRTDATVYDDRDLAMAMLQRELDSNEHIQAIAENRGIKELTAKAYLGGAISDTHFPIDEYAILVRRMNQSMAEIEEDDHDN